MITSSAVIMPRSPWLASLGCTKIGRRAGRGEGRRDLAADMAGLAHAGDDHPAARAADQLDRGDEGLPEPVMDRRRQRADAAGLGLERAHRRCDQGAGALARRARSAEGRRLGHGRLRGSGDGEGGGIVRDSAEPGLAEPAKLNGPLTISVLTPLTKALGRRRRPSGGPAGAVDICRNGLIRNTFLGARGQASGGMRAGRDQG